MILAIETSTPVCSVAIEGLGRRVLEKRIEGRGVHSERTFTFIRELLERSNIEVSDLDAILFSNGPGSYTGLRIGAGAVKGLLFGRTIPLFIFPTLLSFTASASAEGKNYAIHSVIDARRQHLYHQKTEVDMPGKMTIHEPAIAEISKLNEVIKPGDAVIGTGWERLEPREREKITWLGTEAISARNLIFSWRNEQLKPYYNQADPEQFEPDYLTMSQINNSENSG